MGGDFGSPGGAPASGQAEGDSERGVELPGFNGSERSAAAFEDGFGEGEDIVAVRGAVVVEAVVGAEGDFGDVAMERRCYEDADDCGDGGQRAVSGDDDNGVSPDARYSGVPDVAPADQRPLLARHAAAENWAIAATIASVSGSGWL